MNYKEKFAKNLKLLREEKDLSQQNLARELKVSRAIISYWENGIKEPTLTSLTLLADYFSCTIDYLVGRED